MRNLLLPALFAGALLAASSAHADVFSSQSFTGDAMVLNNLPGVNLDVAPGFEGGAGNCEEADVSSFSTRDAYGGRKGTTCKFGNFSITTTGSTAGNHYDTTYGGNPPPWMQGWRP